jgi:hypothetical protein
MLHCLIRVMFLFYFILLFIPFHSFAYAWLFSLVRAASSPHTSRDGNLGTGTRYLLGTRPDGYGYEDDFLPAGGTRTRLELRQVRDGYFFPPTGNLTGTQYFTTTIILCCEQVKMCSFCYINYHLF